MSAHPNITDAWTEWTIENGSYKTVLVVETDLETRPDSPAFDSSTFDDMVGAIVKVYGNHPAERIRVIPKRVPR